MRKRRGTFLVIDNFHGTFGSGLIFKSLEAVISSGEMSEGNIVLRLLIVGFAEIGNTFSELVPEVESTQIGGAVSIEIVVSLLSETEKKY